MERIIAERGSNPEHWLDDFLIHAREEVA